MIQEKYNEEQPIIEQAEVSNETENESVASCEGSSESGTEVELGKFKSPKALLEAYNSLQAEFTKKCQKLSEFEKDKTLQASSQNNDDKFEKFLSSNQDAKEYREEFASFLDSQQNEIGSLDGAWAKFVLGKLSSREEGHFEEPIAQKYIFQDENVRNKIIENYIKELNHKKPPIIMSNQSGQRVAEQKPVTPVSLSDAKKLVEEMFS